MLLILIAVVFVILGVRRRRRREQFLVDALVDARYKAILITIFADGSVLRHALLPLTTEPDSGCQASGARLLTQRQAVRRRRPQSSLLRLRPPPIPSSSSVPLCPTSVISAFHRRLTSHFQPIDRARSTMAATANGRDYAAENLERQVSLFFVNYQTVS